MSGYFGIYYGKHIATFGPFLTCQHLLDSEKLNCYRLRLARLNEEMREDNEIAQGKIFLRVLDLFFSDLFCLLLLLF